MRGRPRVQVLLRPGGVAPGETLEVEAVLTSRTRTPVDYVDLVLEGTLRTLGMNQTSLVGSEPTILRLQARATPGTLLPGEKKIRARFALPPGLPPTFVGDALFVSYVLRVHVSIPWWPDRVADYLVPVILGSGSVPAPPSLRYVAHALGGAPQALVSFRSLALRPDDVLEGEVVFRAAGTSPGGRLAARRVELDLVAEERDERTSGRVTKPRHTLVVLAGPPVDGQAIPFRTRLPTSMSSSFRGPVASLDWFVSLRAVTLVGPDWVVSAPLTVLPVPFRAGSSPLAVAAAQRQRMYDAWESAATARGLRFEVTRPAIVGSVEGIGVDVALERASNREVLAARLTYPPFGVELFLSERRLFEFLIVDSIDLSDPELSRRFLVRGREAAQVRALLGPELLALIKPLVDVTIEDSKARFTGRAGGKTEESIVSFLDRVVAIARLLARGASELPLPAALAPHEAVWAAFAERHHARLLRGSGAIVGGSIEGQPFELRPVLDDTSYAGTLLRVPIEPPLASAPNVEDPSLSPHARGLLREALAAATDAWNEVHLAPDAIECHVEGAVTDPGSLLSLLERWAQVARALRGLEGAGPFR